MKIEKRGAESYRVRKMYKGQMYTVTFDHKPTQKEAMQAMAAELDKAKGKYHSVVFQGAAEKYIESKRNVLSPSTIRGYVGILKNLSPDFLDKRIQDITALDIQEEINRLAKEHTPKTVRNYHGFISAVLGTFCPNLKISTTLPQKVKNEPYIPSDEDVQRILEHAKGTEYEIPLILACYGLRRSEICALHPEDIDGDTVRINKAIVQNEKEEWVIKATKTTASTREIIIPLEIAEKIQEKGYVYKGHPHSIAAYLRQTEKELEIPFFPLHKLRHYFASKMSAMNIPEVDIMRMGGWQTDRVMKAVYRHSMIDKEARSKREASKKLRDVIFSGQNLDKKIF